MRFESAVVIAAPAELVWQTYLDVERWPEWTDSVTRVERLDDGPLRVGSRTKVKQPKLPIANWTVTELVEGEHFTWVAKGPGVLTTAGHTVTVIGTGQVQARATLTQPGPMGVLLGRVTRNLTMRYLDTELAGLKLRCADGG